MVRSSNKICLVDYEYSITVLLIVFSLVSIYLYIFSHKKLFTSFFHHISIYKMKALTEDSNIFHKTVLYGNVL